MAANIF